MADAADFAVEPPHHQKWDAGTACCSRLHGIKLQATGMRMKLMQCFFVMHGLCEQSISAIAQPAC